MARKRVIKSEFFENEKFGMLSFGARLLFIGIWTLSDIEGRIKFNPSYLKSSIFPYDNISSDSIFSYMMELIDNNLIERYTGGETKQTYAVVLNVKKRKRFPKRSQLPAPTQMRDWE